MDIKEVVNSQANSSLAIASGCHSTEETLEELKKTVDLLLGWKVTQLDILQAFKYAKFHQLELGRKIDAHCDKCVKMVGDLLKLKMPLNIFSIEIRNAIERIEIVLSKNFGFIPDYEIINLKDTRPQGRSSRNYEALRSVEEKKGLYLFFETPNSNVSNASNTNNASNARDAADDVNNTNTPMNTPVNTTVDSIFYVGKTGKSSASNGCDVFYKSGIGSGRIPHHIVGGKKVLFKKAHRLFAPQGMKYNDFVNRYSVLFVIIDNERIRYDFEKLLLWWEAYLILELLPVMNENLEIKLGKAATSHADFKKYWPYNCGQ